MQNSSQAAEYLKSAANAIERNDRASALDLIEVAVLLMDYDAGCKDARQTQTLLRATLNGLAKFNAVVDR